MKQTLKILIVEPSEIITQGLSALLKRENFTICGVEHNTANLKDLLAAEHPDVVVINPTLSAPDGTPLHTFLSKYKNLNVVALLYQYVVADVLKNYTKTIDIQDDAKYICKIFHGFDSAQTSIPNAENYELSSRETDVLKLLVKGLLNKEIADRLNISIHTVMSHRKNIIRKTGIKTVAGLTVYAMLNNLME